jgi:hypothetical protein
LTDGWYVRPRVTAGTERRRERETTMHFPTDNEIDRMEAKAKFHEWAHAEIDRMEAEAGCELPDLNVCGGATLTQRAQRLLDCDDPPIGEDLETCRRVAGLE